MTPPTSSQMVQVTTECVVEQEDTRRELHVAFMDIIMLVKQLMTTMQTVCLSFMECHVAIYGLMLLDYMTILQIQVEIVHVLLMEDQPLLPL